MQEPVVMFGIGATKAGTTWLHRYLSAHSECALPAIKELHYFDSLEGARMPGTLGGLRKRHAALEGKPARAAERVALAEWIAVMERAAQAGGATPEYRDFLMRGAEGKRLVADITPSYALLSEGWLARMQGIAAQVRFVYLLRDPVDRLWSQLRMVAKRSLTAGADLAAHADAVFDAWAAGGHPGATARGDYAAILPKLRRVLRPDTLLLQFYETLFSDDAMARLCRFLGLTPRAGDYHSRVHEGVALTLSPERRAVAQRLLAPQYRHVAQAFGPLPARWLTNFPEGAR